MGKHKDSFTLPVGIAINDKTGNIVVTDRCNNRVQLFRSKGKYFKTVSAKELSYFTSVTFSRSNDIIAIVSY